MPILQNQLLAHADRSIYCSAVLLTCTCTCTCHVHVHVHGHVHVAKGIHQMVMHMCMYSGTLYRPLSAPRGNGAGVRGSLCSVDSRQEGGQVRSRHEVVSFQRSRAELDARMHRKISDLAFAYHGPSSDVEKTVLDVVGSRSVCPLGFVPRCSACVCSRVVGVSGSRRLSRPIGLRERKKNKSTEPSGFVAVFPLTFCNQFTASFPF
jgi:hypothetical protein